MPVTELKDRRLYGFGSFVVDLEERKLWKEQKLVQLTPKVFQTFTILFQNRDQVVTKQALLDALWPDCYVDEANLTQNISVLRKALDETNSGTKFIVTFPRRGYRFVGDVQVIDAAETDSVPAPVAPVPDVRQRPQRGIVLWIALFAGLAIIASAVLWASFRAGKPGASRDFEAGLNITRLPGHEYQPAVSPDGTKIAFVHSRRMTEPLRIGIVARDEAAIPQILDTPGCDAFSPAWSPDGKSLAYLCHKERELLLMIRDEQNHERTVAHLYPAREGRTMRHLDWSPDGRLLAVSDKRTSDEPFRIDLIHIAEGRRSPLTVPPALSDGDFEPRFSPDGKHLALLRVNSRRSMDIFVVRMPGSGSIEEVTRARQVFTGLDWSPDSKSLFFSARRDGVVRVWRVPADRSRPGWEPTSLAGERSVQFSIARKTGQTAMAVADTGQNIWRADFDSPEGLSWERLIASAGSDSCPVYDPGGQRIAFLSDRTGQLQLWLRHGDGRESVLTAGGLSPNYASWARSGTHLYFSSYTQRKLYRINVTGGEPELMNIDGPIGGHIAVTPDERSVLLVQRFNVFEAPFTGRPKTLVSDQGGFPLRTAFDDDFIYYVRNRFSNEIWRLRRSTSEVTLISDRLWPGCWGCWDISKSGILVYVTRLSSGLPQLERLNLKTGHRTVLGLLPSRQVTMSNGMIALSPDGKQLLADIVEPGNGDIHWSEFMN